MNHFAVGLTLFLCLPSPPARATGACEGQGVHLEPIGYSLSAHAVVFGGHVEFCQEDPENGEETSELPVKVVMGFGGGVRGRFLVIEKGTPTVAQIAHAGSLLGGAVKLAPAWQKEAAALGTLERPALVAGADRKSQHGTCEVRVPLGKAAKGTDGFDKAKLSVSVHAAGKEIFTRGLAWTTPDDPPAFAIFDRQKGAMTVVWVATICTGGPPPGYFGEDDAGECYDSDKPGVLTFKSAKVKKQLAACFGP